MSIDIKVPTVGESITEGTLSRWLKKEGAFVNEGEPVFELETDKATGEVSAPAAGRLAIKVKEGATVAIGSVVGLIDPDSKASKDGLAPKPPSPPAAKLERAPDVAKPTPPPAAIPPQVDSSPVPAAAPRHDEPPRAKETTPVAAALPRQEEPAATAPPTVHADREVRKPMSRLRKTIADRLVSAQHAAAILTTFNEADMSQILEIRAQFKERFKERHGVGLGFMSFFIKAAVEALKAFPTVNARIDGSDIVEQNFYDVGVAVSTDRGLMVPIVRDADRLHFAELEKAVEAFAAKARDGKITVEDLQGGTFTITNGGVFGSLLSTPVLNPPQSAILGMHTIQKRPVAVGDKVEIRPMMYLALSYDHRLIDGREAVLFLKKVKECVENPLQLLWGV
jgi:2-oxoglutarate dehydrogenase E2 component (dihydrolipoamide succinyltransferase)